MTLSSKIVYAVYSQNESLFVKLVAGKEAQNIYYNFYVKLCKDYAYDWIYRLTNLPEENKYEILSYYQLIINYVISSNEVKQNLKITENNVNQGGQGDIHYGIFKNEEVAIKQQQFGPNSQDQQFMALLREMAIISFCQHPNIGKIKAIHFHPNQGFVQIIQPKYFINLEAAVDQGYIKNQKKKICCQILEALAYLHDNKLIHLDLKPSNIMLQTKSYYDIVLVDFGISNIYKQSETKILAASSFYAPPEIKFNTLTQLSPKADIFSFGITLYEIITENSAFYNYLNKHVSQIYNLIRSPNFEFFAVNKSTGNLQLDEFIKECTNREPCLRPTAAQALKMIQKIQID